MSVMFQKSPLPTQLSSTFASCRAPQRQLPNTIFGPKNQRMFRAQTIKHQTHTHTHNIHALIQHITTTTKSEKCYFPFDVVLPHLSFCKYPLITRTLCSTKLFGQKKDHRHSLIMFAHETFWINVVDQIVVGGYIDEDDFITFKSESTGRVHSSMFLFLSL